MEIDIERDCWLMWGINSRGRVLGEEGGGGDVGKVGSVMKGDVDGV